MRTQFQAAQLADADTAACEQILRKCVHCGFCTATCPTYVLLGDELDSPRGRIYLIKDMLEGSKPATSAIVPHIDRCLSCLACMTSCPSGVHYQHLIDHARVHVERTYRRPVGERLLRFALAWTLPYPRRMQLALRLARWASAATRWLPDSLRRRAPLPRSLRAALALAARATPTGVSHPPAARRRRGDAKSSAAPRERIALLAGCAQSMLAPQTEAASVRLLERAGWHVTLIGGCCGALVHHLGRDAHSRALAQELLGRIAAAERDGAFAALAVTASGCGTHLKDLGYVLRNDPTLAAPAARLSACTRDISELLHAAVLDGRLTFSASGARPAVAYQSACSMQHGQHLDELPRRLLELAGFGVRQVPESHLCCGSAGTYNLLQPRLAEELRARKLENLRRTGAELAASGNIGCIVQLTNDEMPIVHTAELLDWALGGPTPAVLRARQQPCADAGARPER